MIHHLRALQASSDSDEDSDDSLNVNMYMPKSSQKSQRRKYYNLVKRMSEVTRPI